MSPRRGAGGRFIADEATERFRHDIFGTASAESAFHRFCGVMFDGDGCVGIYPTPQGNPMLHLSFVGTPSFIQGAMAAIPAHGRCRVIAHCKSLQEARYHGRYAWAAATWLYADTGLFQSAKQRAFARYQQLLRTDPPKWHTWAIERQRMLTLMKAGKTPAQIAAQTGLPVSRIYTLGYRTRKAAPE